MKTTQKKGFVARDFVVATIIFSGIVALFVLQVGALANDYENTEVVDEDFAASFDRFNDQTADIERMFNATDSDDGLTVIGTFEILFNSAFSVIGLVFDGVRTAGSQIIGFGDYFGIPTEVSRVFLTILVAGLTALIVFIVISTTTRRDL